MDIILRTKTAPPVGEQPHAHLEYWRVREHAANWHLYGFCPELGCFRRTTPVHLLDLSRQLAVTASGRQYQLVGPPATRGPGLDSGIDDQLRTIAAYYALRKR